MTQPPAGQFPQSLERVDIFSSFAPEAMARLQKRCTWRRYEAGEPIVDHLDASRDVYFITTRRRAGDALLRLGDRRDLHRSRARRDVRRDRGDRRRRAIGEHRGAHALRRRPMPAAVFREVLRSEPEVAQALLARMAGRIRVLTTRIYEFSALAVNNRIQAEILRLAAAAHREGKSARIDTAPTHAELASRVSTHREAVTRELNRLAQSRRHRAAGTHARDQGRRSPRADGA